MSDIFVLGINASHDIACALVKNGELVCAIAEERLNRVKRFSGGVDQDGMTNKHLPQESIQYCLEAGKVNLEDVDLIVVSTCVVVNYATFQTRTLTKQEILDQLPGNIDSDKVHIVSHHLGHAASAFYPSEFSDAAVIVVDGGGSLFYKTEGDAKYYEERVSIYAGKEESLNLVQQYSDEGPSDGHLANPGHCSLGDFYQSATLFIGFKPGDEGKTMGLAPYGTEVLYKDFEAAIEFSDGKLSIKQEFQFNKWFKKDKEYYDGCFGKPTNFGDPIRQIDKDIAAAAQHALEKVLIKIARKAYEKTKSKNLCLAGGVALNSVANKKILDETPFENIFVQPASGDDGCALGNALLGWSVILQKPRVWCMRNAYTGRSYSKEEVQQAVEQYKGWVEVVDTQDAIKETARLISERKIIGWFQGGSEFGPRALGHRSILCDTRFAEMKDILNARVKYREGFRPFAPAILEEFNSEYFELDCPSPVMLLIAKVKKPNVIPAITHIDGTARVQTVNKEDNDVYYGLIEEYYKLTGVPVILNTSFNVAGEPIVETPEDAIRCCLATRIDYLVLGDVLLKKKDLKCYVFRVWPQDLKRLLFKKFKALSSGHPFLKNMVKGIKRFIGTPIPKNIKMPG